MPRRRLAIASVCGTRLLLQSIGRAVEDVGGGAGYLLDKTGEALKHIGEGAKGAVEDLGQGAGQ